jgi:hypothetical protein
MCRASCVLVAVYAECGIFHCYAGCRRAKCRFAECHGARFHLDSHYRHHFFSPAPVQNFGSTSSRRKPFGRLTFRRQSSRETCRPIDCFVDQNHGSFHPRFCRPNVCRQYDRFMVVSAKHCRSNVGRPKGFRPKDMAPTFRKEKECFFLQIFD